MQKVKLWIDLDQIFKNLHETVFFGIRFEMYKRTDNIAPICYKQWHRWPGTRPARSVNIVRDEMHQLCRKRHWKSLMVHYIKGDISQKQFKTSIWIKDLFNTGKKSRGFVMKIGALTNLCDINFRYQSFVTNIDFSVCPGL